MKKIRLQNNNNIIVKMFRDRFFEDSYKSIVVLANPKTILNAKYAKKEVKQKVIRADQLVKHIKEICSQSKELEVSETKVLEWARSYKALHKYVEKDYTAKYDKYKVVKSKDVKVNSTSTSMPKVETGLIEDTDIYKELKAYRLRKSREENIKAYVIYNNNQLKDLIARMPKTKEGLLAVQGFGKGKVDKYGEDIVGVVCKY